MGNKVHATSFRLSTLKNWTSLWFDDSFKNSSLVQQDIIIKNFLINYFYQRNISISNIFINRDNNGLITINCSFYLLNGLIKSKFPFTTQNNLFFANHRKFLPRLKVKNTKQLFNQRNNYSIKKNFSYNFVLKNNHLGIIKNKFLTNKFIIPNNFNFVFKNSFLKKQPSFDNNVSINKLFLNLQVVHKYNFISSSKKFRTKSGLKYFNENNFFIKKNYFQNLSNTSTNYDLLLLLKSKLIRINKLRESKRYYFLRFRMRDLRKKSFKFISSVKYKVNILRKLISYGLLLQHKEAFKKDSFLMHYNQVKILKKGQKGLAINDRRFFISLSNFFFLFYLLKGFEKNKKTSFNFSKKNLSVYEKSSNLFNFNKLNRKKTKVILGNTFDLMLNKRKNNNNIFPSSLLTRYLKYNLFNSNLKLAYYLNKEKFKLKNNKMKFSMLYRTGVYKPFHFRNRKRRFLLPKPKKVHFRKFKVKKISEEVLNTSKKNLSPVILNATQEFSNDFVYKLSENISSTVSNYLSDLLSKKKKLKINFNRTKVQDFQKFELVKPRPILNTFANEKYYYYALIKYNLYYVNKIIKKISGVNAIKWEFFIQKQFNMGSNDVLFYLKKNLNKKKQQKLANPIDLLKGQLSDNLNYLEQISQIKNSLWAANSFNLYTKLHLKQKFDSKLKENLINIENKSFVLNLGKLERLFTLGISLDNVSFYKVSDKFIDYTNSFYFSKLNLSSKNKNILLRKKPFLLTNVSYYYKDLTNNNNKLSLYRERNNWLKNFNSIFNSLVKTKPDESVYNFTVDSAITNKVNRKFYPLIKGFHIVGRGRLGLSRKSARTSTTEYKIGKTVKNSLNISIDFISNHHIIRNGSYGLKIYKLYQLFNVDKYKQTMVSLFNH